MPASATTTTWTRKDTHHFLEEVMDKWEREGLDHFRKQVLTINPGRKYDKIVASDPSHPFSNTPGHPSSSRVWGFVERATGNLYKASGWSAPAKGVRYHLADPASYEEALYKADVFAGFLYIR